MPLLLDRPFSRRSALAAGLTPGELRGLVSARLVRRVLDGVYVGADVPDSFELRCAAVALALPAGAALCREGAAWLYGVDTRDPARRDDPPRLDIAVPRGTTIVRRRGIRCFVQDLSPVDLRLLDGVAVTSPLRTGIDLARWLPRPDALCALDALAHTGVLDLDEARAGIVRWAEHAFVVQAREVLVLADAGSESWGESRCRLRLHDAGFPAPELQICVRIGDRSFRLDMGWKARRKALEYDGEAHHSSADDRASDQERRALLRRAGWDVAVVTKEHVLGGGTGFEQVVAELLGMPPTRGPASDWR
ncbi:hypothetical protein [Motilibacter deserti]|uniref:DUF559 domain-containing protein n=1 Tax=Motilibacter deserti TaxID=2714956 RepID=A0ABX0GSV4_9ACTN|nr:hypothetical protein [Motilibacter deserti]NHC13969.1 hypothetical protein [Motilibacter deserti]